MKKKKKGAHAKRGGALAKSGGARAESYGVCAKTVVRARENPRCAHNKSVRARAQKETAMPVQKSAGARA